MKLTTVSIGLGIVGCCVFSFVHADQENMDRALKQAVSDYASGGEPAMTKRAKFCYDSVDYGHANWAQRAGVGVEYCFAYETAAVAIMHERGGYKSVGYFAAENVMSRAALYLEKARVVTLPEQFGPYVQSRVDYIRETIPGML